MQTFLKAVIGTVVGGGAVVGCSHDAGPRYVERVPVAAPDTPATRLESDPVRPMPDRPGQAPGLR